MGSAASARTKDDSISIDQSRRMMLLQRKVTVDILDRLARRLPQMANPLGKTLKLEKDTERTLAWQANLSYLQEWKKSRRDEATIGNLINLLKAAGHKPEEYECLFNISREPRNVSTVTETTDKTDDVPSQPTKTPRPYQIKPVARPEDCTRSQLQTSMETILLPHDHQMMGKNKANSTISENQVKYAKYEYTFPDQERSMTGYSNIQLQSTHKPLFLTEGKLHSCSTEDDHHSWLDFRNWNHVTKSWNFINETTTRKEKIGNYFPGLVVLNKMIVVSDTNKNKLHYFDKWGDLLKSHSTGKLTPGGMCKINSETIGVCCGRVVAVWNINGHLLRKFGEGVFRWCRGICLDSDNRFIVSDVELNDVTIHTQNGHLVASLNISKEYKLNGPYHVAVDRDDQILVSDSRNSCIRRFNKHGTHLNTFSHFGEKEDQLKVPMALTTDCSGNVLICDYGNSRISVYNNNGWFLKHILTKSRIKRPVTVVAFDHKKVLVSMMDNCPLKVFDFE